MENPLGEEGQIAHGEPKLPFPWNYRGCDSVRSELAFPWNAFGFGGGSVNCGIASGSSPGLAFFTAWEGNATHLNE